MFFVFVRLKYTQNFSLITHPLQKPSNVLITLEGHLKLTDFGLAGSMVKRKRAKKNKVSTRNMLGLQANPYLLAEMAKAKPDEPTGSTEDLSSESSSIIKICEKTSEDNLKNDRGKENSFRLKGVKWVRRRTVCGTAGYRPPEQVQERFVDYFSRSGYDERADWFSLGVCCFTMLAGRRPFPTKKELMQSDSQRVDLMQTEQMPSKLEGKLQNDPEFRCLMFDVQFPEQFIKEQDARNFVQALLSRNPEERLHYEGIINHPWMKGEDFNESTMLAKAVPEWVKTHAHQGSIAEEDKYMHRKMKRRASYGTIITRQSTTLGGRIEDLCSECYEKNGSKYAENFAFKWLTIARPETVKLFRHWNYISDEALSLEVASNCQNRKVTSPQRLAGMRRQTCII